jgi:hypothetical protein
MAFPTSSLTNNQVHKEGNRAFVYDSALGVWDQVRETDRTDNKILHGEIGSGVTFPAGHIIQVGFSTYSTQVTSSTDTFIDTGLSLSITPSTTSSKILVMVSHPSLDKRTNNAWLSLELQKDGSTIYTPNNQIMYTGTTGNNTASCTFNYLDSPSTTSSVAYKTRFRSSANNAVVACQWAGPSTITLMEIAG